MFFIMLCINLTLYIATGFAYYNGNTKLAIIYGVIALIFTCLAINFYRNKKKRFKKKKANNHDDGSDCVDCFQFGFEMDKKSWFDCMDIQCGKKLDCGGMDCDAPDCNCT